MHYFIGVKLHCSMFVNQFFMLTLMWLAASSVTLLCPGEGNWRTCVRRMELMPNAHSDLASEQYFTISAKQVTTKVTILSTWFILIVLSNSLAVLNRLV